MIKRIATRLAAVAVAVALMWMVANLTAGDEAVDTTLATVKEPRRIPSVTQPHEVRFPAAGATVMFLDHAYSVTESTSETDLMTLPYSRPCDSSELLGPTKRGQAVVVMSSSPLAQVVVYRILLGDFSKFWFQRTAWGDCGAAYGTDSIRRDFSWYSGEALTAGAVVWTNADASAVYIAQANWTCASEGICPVDERVTTRHFLDFVHRLLSTGSS